MRVLPHILVVLALVPAALTAQEGNAAVAIAETDVVGLVLGKGFPLAPAREDALDIGQRRLAQYEAHNVGLGDGHSGIALLCRERGRHKGEDDQNVR